MSGQERLKRIREELKQTFLERSELIDGALTGLICAQHVLIVGPPGTAKSMLANEVCRRIEGTQYFQWLLTRFTTPEELFGAVSLKALEEDDYRRVTARKLPEAHIAFLDEIFKANSSILNAILSIINERVFFNGKQMSQVPLLTLFGASNELPEEDELRALYDRFLLRFVVEYISEDFRFLRMLEGRASSERTTISLEELRLIQQEARDVEVASHVYKTIADIRRELGKKNMVASDRRYHQCLALLQAHAYLNGRKTVSENDLLFLEHALWNDPGEQTEVRSTIKEMIFGHEQEVQELLYQAREIEDYAMRPWETEELRAQALVEVHTKLRHILTKVGQIFDQAEGLSRSTEKVEAIRREIVGIQERILERF